MTKSNHTILLADEDDATRAYLTTNLTADGYRVRAAEDRAKAIALLSLDQPDLIIADVNGHTLDLVDAVRSGDGLASHLDPDTPMIVLSERADEIHRIRVLERGGDDVIAKPFSYAELRARVAAVLRRRAPAPPTHTSRRRAHDRPERPGRARPRQPAHAVGQGVRAPRRPRPRPAPRVHQSGATPSGVGIPHTKQNDR